MTPTDLRYPYQGPDELAPAIDHALRQVVDPEVALSIVDVGLVCSVRVVDHQVEVQVTMTSAACPVTDVILADIEAELHAALPPQWAVKVDVVWDPVWSPERMSPRAKAFMGW